MEREIGHLKNDCFDVVIIGGGITGAGIARDAALRGFRVCLLEKDDFAGATSSRSSKLIHGGLRYLEHLEFSLVQESLRERACLLHIAPHLVRPLPFIIPVYESQKQSALRIKMGLTLYDMLAGKSLIKKHESLTRDELLKYAPGIKTNGMKTVYRYYDAQMNDARLCLENILDAEKYGAQCWNDIRVEEFHHDQQRISGVKVRDLASGQNFSIFAKQVINATGPWLDRTLQLTGKKIHPKLRLSQGIHIVVPKLSTQALLLFTKEDNRVFFCIPWAGQSLIGTTDTDSNSDPDLNKVSRKDVQYLMNALSAYFPHIHQESNFIHSLFSGYRPLVRKPTIPVSRVSREYVIEETLPGLLGVYGGKYTTYRNLAEKAVDKVAHLLQLHLNQKSQTAELALPGAQGLKPPEHYESEFTITRNLAEHLWSHYGSRTQDIIRMQNEFGLSGSLCTEHPHIKAELVFAFVRDKARSLEDFLTRRTWIRYTACRGLKCLDTCGNILEELSIFSSEEIMEQKLRYKKAVEGDLITLL